MRLFAIDDGAGRHRPRHDLAMPGDDDLFPGLDPVEQLTQFIIGFKGSDLAHAAPADSISISFSLTPFGLEHNKSREGRCTIVISDRREEVARSVALAKLIEPLAELKGGTEDKGFSWALGIPFSMSAD